MKKIFAKVASSINCLSVDQSFQQRQSPDTESSAVPASNSVEEHAEHSDQRSLEQQPSAMVKPIFATMQTDNTAELEGSSDNPTKCDWS